MGKRYLPLWFGILLLTMACGTGGSVAEAPTPDTASREDAPAVPQESPVSDTTEPAPTQPLVVEAAPTALEDTTVIPGERVGLVTRETSRAELAELFGEVALEDTEIPVGEGFTELGTTVNAGTEQAFAVIWVDETQARPATVKDFGTAWQTPEGIHVGMTFAELKPLLGSFDLYGFGWDYQGTVVLEGSDLADYYGDLILRLNPDQAAIAQNPDAYAAVQGDKLLSSEDPNLPPLDLVVEQMIVYLNSPAQ